MQIKLSSSMPNYVCERYLICIKKRQSKHINSNLDLVFL